MPPGSSFEAIVKVVQERGVVQLHKLAGVFVEKAVIRAFRTVADSVVLFILPGLNHTPLDCPRRIGLVVFQSARQRGVKILETDLRTGAM